MPVWWFIKRDASTARANREAAKKVSLERGFFIICHRALVLTSHFGIWAKENRTHFVSASCILPFRLLIWHKNIDFTGFFSCLMSAALTWAAFYFVKLIVEDGDFH